MRDEALALAIKARRELGTLDTTRDPARPRHAARSRCIRPATPPFGPGQSASQQRSRTSHGSGIKPEPRTTLLEAFPRRSFRPHDRAALDCARAMLAFQLGDSEPASAPGAAVAVDEVNGIGEFRGSPRAHWPRNSCLLARDATRMGSRITSLLCRPPSGSATTRCALVPAAILPCASGDWGCPRDQLNWAQRALAYQGNRFEGYTELQAAYWAALGYASLDDRTAALDTISRVDARIPDRRPESIRSVWTLMKADILWASGNEAPARAAAVEASLANRHLTFEGRYARWLAATATTREDLTRAHARSWRP